MCQGARTEAVFQGLCAVIAVSSSRRGGYHVRDHVTVASCLALSGTFEVSNNNGQRIHPVTTVTTTLTIANVKEVAVLSRKSRWRLLIAWTL